MCIEVSPYRFAVLQLARRAVEVARMAVAVARMAAPDPRPLLLLLLVGLLPRPAQTLDPGCCSVRPGQVDTDHTSLAHSPLFQSFCLFID